MEHILICQGKYLYLDIYVLELWSKVYSPCTAQWDLNAPAAYTTNHILFHLLILTSICHYSLYIHLLSFVNSHHLTLSPSLFSFFSPLSHSHLKANKDGEGGKKADFSNSVGCMCCIACTEFAHSCYVYCFFWRTKDLLLSWSKCWKSPNRSLLTSLI